MKSWPLYALMLLVFTHKSIGQHTTLNDSLQTNQYNKGLPAIHNYTIKKQLIHHCYVPAVAIGYGIATQWSLGLKKWDANINRQVTPSNQSSKISVDDYLQFAPGAISLGMTASGVKGKYGLKDALLSYGITNLILFTIVAPTKYVSHRIRPDSSAYTSFPSRHTAEAFANAEFLRIQYGNRYPLLAVTGYAMASATGYLRMYNNRHWFSDVIAGAAIGFCSARFASWIYTKIHPRIFPSTHHNTSKIATTEPIF